MEENKNLFELPSLTSLEGSSIYEALDASDSTCNAGCKTGCQVGNVETGS